MPLPTVRAAELDTSVVPTAFCLWPDKNEGQGLGDNLLPDCFTRICHGQCGHYQSRHKRAKSDAVR